MTYSQENEAKATFDDVYVQPTPHAYVGKMAQHGYQIGEQARPYCLEASRLLQEHNSDAWSPRVLDLGCSYGMGSAFLKYGCSFDEIVAFFASRAPKDFTACAEVTRMWLNVTSPLSNLICVGVDSSEPAITFALAAGLLDGGIATDFESSGVEPSDTDIEWFRSCNLLVSTGAIGYVTETTLDKILPHLGKDHPANHGPLAVITILRMFDEGPIVESFARAGLKLTRVPGIHLPQRNFADESERAGVLDILTQKGLDVSEMEENGTMYADLFIAAPAAHVRELVSATKGVKERVAQESAFAFIHR